MTIKRVYRLCPECGCKIGPLAVVYPNCYVPTGMKKLSVDDSSISDKWLWALASVPIPASWLILIIAKTCASVLMSSGGAVGIDPYNQARIFSMLAQHKWVLTILLNSVFLIADKEYLRRKDKNPNIWIWLGLILVPVYLFARANCTTKNFWPCVVWLSLFVWDILIFVGFAL